MSFRSRSKIAGFLAMAAVTSPLFAAVPDQPLGIKGIANDRIGTITLLWEPVRQSVAGEPLGQPAKYNVYRRSKIDSAPVKINTYALPVTVFAEPLDVSHVSYYSVRAVDADGAESEESLLADSSPQNNVLFIASDGRTHLTISDKDADLLRPRTNGLGVPLALRLKEAPARLSDGVVRNIEFEFLRGDTKAPVPGLAFGADMDVRIGYSVVNGQVALGAPQLAAASPVVTEATPEQLGLYWHNGMTWLRVGGVVDADTQTVYLKSSQLGRYQLRIAARADQLTLQKANVYPPVFTPNGDGYNDRVFLVVENPNNASLLGEVYDVGGRLVAELPSASVNGSLSTLSWTGQDSNGAVVPSGVYVYRVRGDDKTVTGTVAVVR